MSNSPIFDQLAREFALKCKPYEEISRFDTPAFRWSGPSHVVQLDKQTRVGGTRLGKVVRLELPPAEQPPSFNMQLPAIVRVEAPNAPDAVEVKPNADSTLSLVTEGLHPTVKPLSAKDTAQPME